MIYEPIRKANPTVSDVHVSAPLTDMSVAYWNEDDAFVAERAFPVVPVLKQGDKYYEYDRQDWLRADAKPRAAGAVAERGGYRLSTNPYFCERIALGFAIPDPVRENADPAVSNMDADGVQYLNHQIKLKLEKDFVTDLFTTSIWTGASSTTDMTGQATPTSTSANFTQWNDVTATPIEDIHGEAVSITKRTGRKPNKLTLGADVYRHLSDHPDIIDRIKYTERGIVTADLLAALFGVGEVLVSWAANDTAIEGAAASYGFVAGKSALLAYVSPTPSLRQPSAGYHFVWTGRPGAPAGGLGARIKRYRDEPAESDIFEAEIWVDRKVVGAQLGAFFTTATA